MSKDLPLGRHEFTPFDLIPGTMLPQDPKRFEEAIFKIVKDIFPDEQEPLLWEGDQA